MEVANQRKDSTISKTLAEDVVWVLSPSMFFSKYMHNFC